MSKSSLLASIMALVSMTDDAAADPLTDAMRLQLSTISGTLSVSSEPQFSEGELVGCTFSFEALQQDWVYLEGDFIRVSGSFGFLGTSETQATVVKVTAVRVAPTVPELEVSPLVPRRGYLIDSKLTGNYDSLVESTISDTGGLFSVYQMSSGAQTIIQALYDSRVIVAVGLDGSSDIRLPVELDVVDVTANGDRQRSPQAVEGFAACAATLVGG